VTHLPSNPSRPPHVDDPVNAVRGIGPRLSAQLAAVGVSRVRDLLLHLPVRYQDRSSSVTVSEAAEQVGRDVLVVGRVLGVRGRRGRRRGTSVVTATVEDDTGRLPVVWFNNRWIERSLRPLEVSFLYGRVRSTADGSPQLVNPEVEGEAPDSGIVPVYAPLGPLSGRRVRRMIAALLPACADLQDPVPRALCGELGLPDLATALRAIHQPCRAAEGDPVAELRRLDERTSAAHRRLALDELVALSSTLVRMRQQRAGQSAPCCHRVVDVGGLAARLVPFALTGAQQRVAGEILKDLEGPAPMARLVQGDVGSGKTVVASMAMVTAAESGFQAVLMAPTELLAEQHARSLAGHLAASGLEPVLLTGSLRAAERRQALEGIQCGRARVVVGTHALFQEGVQFERLGLVVVDEQHRFGVRQRQSLLAKGRAPHLLVMTATPIPRSMTLTLYGDLSLSVIDELPPGRQPVRTVIRTSEARPKLYDFVRREVAEGGRLYMVFPLIEDSEQVPAEALEASVEEVSQALSGVRVGVLHGRMTAAEKDHVTEAFRSGRVQALLATTVVEVGVDVPEASVMVVVSAQRFGLSQLHQLRGRVGRGPRRSWCVLLVDDEVGAGARDRLEVLRRCHDGFEIAEEDLRLRGPGEVLGTRQWGTTQLRFADLIGQPDLVEQARRVCERLAARGELETVQEQLLDYHPQLSSATTEGG
jgi:ATP-dependent DNA helicase RecG